MLVIREPISSLQNKFRSNSKKGRMPMKNLSELLERLGIPADFGRYENLDSRTSLDLETWRTNAPHILEDIQRMYHSEDDATISLEIRGETIMKIAPFLSQDQIASEELSNDMPSMDLTEPWVTGRSQAIAQDIALSKLLLSEEIAIHVLNEILKPIFKKNPHPHLHKTTGRKISRPAGGSMAMQDYYDAQLWKEFPGIYKVVLWCIHKIKPETYGRVWQLVIPPIMTFLDDYEASHKLEGTILVKDMLNHVPVDILQRTGVDGLVQRSLRNSLSHLNSPETPKLLTQAIHVSVSLTLLTTTLGQGTKVSSSRFEELSSLLGEGIISGIWLYAEDKPEAVIATFRSLPPLLKALDIGCVRFLKALIPQLTYALLPRPLVDRNSRMQLLAIASLETLVDTCRPRIGYWKETILDAIGRCWVDMMDEENNMSYAPSDIQDRNLIKGGLQRLCARLADACPTVVLNDIPRFLEADPAIFKDLFDSIVI